MVSKYQLEKTILDKVVLVAFEEQMIPKYYSWMQDPEILKATATDLMSVEEFYTVYNSWKTDPYKYIYIICDKAIYQPENPELSMIGDVNLFINDDNEGEINIMIAEVYYRNKGIATEVVSFIIQFCENVAKLNKIFAKIDQNNINSQKLFTKVGFIESTRIPEFEEIHFVYNI